MTPTQFMAGTVMFRLVLIKIVALQNFLRGLHIFSIFAGDLYNDMVSASAYNKPKTRNRSLYKYKHCLIIDTFSSRLLCIDCGMISFLKWHRVFLWFDSNHVLKLVHNLGGAILWPITKIPVIIPKKWAGRFQFEMKLFLNLFLNLNLLLFLLDF